MSELVAEGVASDPHDSNSKATILEEDLDEEQPIAPKKAKAPPKKKKAPVKTEGKYLTKISR